ncbi:alpha/beta hydrolase family protein [Paenibacillus mendelii]|uniref:Alpha/beta hydrolase family protein n=1 Tax=Paenibacillus mendelii TaxID=206163 RepID=A0ABV6JG09_9BACL|nr:alpha/beta hydrolase family protein [Paenibacillus mendelii]MCQ6557609.1 alpha/beta hydrolase family protein [Paenibacillus mendelii]
MTARNRWHPDHYLEAMYQEITPKFQFQARNEQEWRAWQEGLTAQFIQDVGGFPANAAPLEPTLLEETDCGEYVRQLVEFTTYPGLSMPAYVLVPKAASKAGDRLPAVIACHGHGEGNTELVGLQPDGVTESASPGYQKNFAVELVLRGFIVIAPDILGFGSRRLCAEAEKNAPNSCNAISTFLLQMGFTMSGHRIYETMRVIDYLQTRTDVDPERIGCMGISGGGLVAAFTSALDKRIKAAVVSGYVNTFKASILSIHHCIDNYIPGLNRHAELPDLVGLIAPRPLLLEMGTQDTIFPIEASIDAAQQIRSIYRILGSEDKFDHDMFEGPHEISGAKAYDWLVRWLA